jgi:hypothetical protein
VSISNKNYLKSKISTTWILKKTTCSSWKTIMDIY